MYNVVNKGFARHTVYVTDVKGFTLVSLFAEKGPYYEKRMTNQLSRLSSLSKFHTTRPSFV
jgi:hypothetical protein